mgnify:CR=1 FL=1
MPLSPVDQSQDANESARRAIEIANQAAQTARENASQARAVARETANRAAREAIRRPSDLPRPSSRRGRRPQSQQPNFNLLEHSPKYTLDSYLFLRRDEINIKLDSYDEKINQFAHPAIIYVLTEEGIISKQIFGINPTSNDLKLSILSAQDNDISSIFDKILLYCYKYDPKAGNYTMIASNVMKIAGASTVFVMGTFLSFFWIRERIV